MEVVNYYWEQRKLGDMMNVTSVKRIHQSDWTDSGIRFLRARDIVAAYKNEEPTDYLFISKEKYDEYSAISGKVKKGDLLVTGVGTIGVPMLINDEKPLYFKDGNIIWFQNGEKINGEFFYYSFIGKSVQYYIQESAGTGTVGTYTIDSGKKTPILIPTDSKEQEQIGAFFTYLDNLITLHQRKLDTLKVVKKSKLEKMFPREGCKVPEVRFSGFTEDWEQRKLGDTNIFFADGNYGEAYPKASDMTDSSTGIPFLTGGNLKNGRLDLSGANYITYEKHMKLTSGHLAEDDIVIAVRGSLGALGYVNKGNSGWNINSQLAILRTDKTVLIGKYLIQFLLSTTGQKELLSKQTGSALKQLPISSLKDIAIPVTSIEEQERIGMYLQNLDHLITLHQRELELLQNLKKSLLEKMFV